MKELKAHLKDEVKIQAKKQQQKESQLDLIGRIKPKRGQFIFEINVITKEVVQAQFVNTTVNYVHALKGDFSGCNEVLIKEGFVYIAALNEANALKKFEKNPNQEAYFSKEALFNLKDISF
jgi:mRNA-degrading endonuclease YafQ of YafQ-DinJ toxin-antitoxin module